MDHTTTMRRMFDLINAGDTDGFGELLTDDFVEHEDIMGFPQTKEGVKQFFNAFGAAFPDVRMEIEDLLVSGDKAVARVRMTGTNEGELMGMPPTGKAIDIEGVDIIRFSDDGLAVEHWGVFDVMKMMQQLGVVPELAPV